MVRLIEDCAISNCRAAIVRLPDAQTASNTLNSRNLMLKADPDRDRSLRVVMACSQGGPFTIVRAKWTGDRFIIMVDIKAMLRQDATVCPKPLRGHRGTDGARRQKF